MRKRSRKKTDAAQNALRVVETATGAPLVPESPKNPHAVVLGRKGGKVGGLARAAAMTPKQRSESARKAAKARWSKKSAPS